MACGEVAGPETGDRVFVGATGYIMVVGDTSSLGFIAESRGRTTYSASLGREPLYDGAATPVWRTEPSGIADVSAEGVLRAAQAGRARIELALGGVRDSASVVVVADVRDATPKFAVLGVGNQHVCGLTSDGRALCWGSSWSGETGTGVSRRFTAALSPAPVATEARFSSLSVGNRHSCALTADGTSYCWGENRLLAVVSG